MLKIPQKWPIPAAVRCFFSLLLALGCLGAPSIGQESSLSPELGAKLDSIRSQFDNAKVKLSVGDFDGAISECATLLEQPERNSEFLVIRAQALTTQSIAYYKSGQYLKAVDAAYLATLEQPDDIAPHRARAEAYIARKEFDKAINSCNRAIGIDEKDAQSYSLRGLAYGSKGNLDQAIADETKAIELNGSLADGFQRRASAYIAKNQLPDAIKDVQRAIELAPNHAEALCDRAILYALNREMDRALADLDAAIASNPRCERANLLKGRCLIEQNKGEEAKAYFDRAVDLSPTADTYLCRGQYFQGQKLYELAVADFSKAIEMDEKLLVAYQGRLACYRNLGAAEDMQADAQRVRELTPKPTKDDKKNAFDVEEARARRFTVSSKPVDPLGLVGIKESAASIDRLVAKNYVAHQVQANPPLTDEQFVRRIYLDVTGTIPTFRQVTGFLNSDNPDKRSVLIDALLSGDGYASHYFNYWADTLRYKDELNGNVRGEPFRQYLKQSLAENKPWNKLVYEMLAAQGRIWDTPATGYLQRDPGMPLDVMNNTLRIFLGTRIGCAQCHNHPFDRWTQKEFYQMAAFTFGTQNSTHGGEKKFFPEDPMKRLRSEFDSIEQEEEDRRNNTYRFDRMIQMNMMVLHDDAKRSIQLPKDYAYDDGKPEEVILPRTLFGSPAEVKENEPPRRAFARWLVSKNNPRFAKTISNRLWKQVFGRGQFEPVDDIKDETVAENPELMTFLESEMVRLNFDMKEYLRILFNTETYQRQACTEPILPGQPYHFPGPILRRITAEQAWDSFITLATENNEYREPKATIKAKAIKFNFQTITAKEVIASEPTSYQLEQLSNEYKSKFMFRGELLARASELPSPIPANHFLRMFGQSDRELIAASSTDGSVPQILFMLNGPISHMLLEENSTIYNNIMRRKSVDDGIRTAFLTILSRAPDPEELNRAMQEVKEKGAAGYGNVVWSLVNTREFLFIQ